MQIYIDTTLRSRKQNFLDRSEPDFAEIQSKNAIVHSADLNYEEYEYCLSISLDEDMHLHLKRYPRSCFENNYFSDGLLSWKANTDIQLAYNAYKSVTYMYLYFSKSEDKCSTLKKGALSR